MYDEKYKSKIKSDEKYPKIQFLFMKKYAVLPRDMIYLWYITPIYGKKRKKERKEKAMYLLYFLLWVIFNGNFTLEICLLGIVIAGGIFAFTCKFMDYSVEKEKQNIRRILKFIRYCCVLVKEIVKANFAVMHMILSEKEEVEPALVSFHSDMETSVGKAMVANAITLTPGTITVSLEDSEYVVHCLDDDLAVGMADSIFVKLISDMEKSK